MGSLKLGNLKLGSLKPSREFIVFSAFASAASAASTATARAFLIRPFRLRCALGR